MPVAAGGAVGALRGRASRCVRAPAGRGSCGGRGRALSGRAAGGIVSRKLGAPGQPEFGIGAVAPGGVRILNERAVRALDIRGGLPEPDLSQGVSGGRASPSALPRGRASLSRPRRAYGHPRG
jgi:hypothetical protein